MLRQLLNEPARVSRRITINTGLTVSIVDANESWLPTKWDEPNTVTIEEDPGDTSPTLLQYTTRLRGLDRGVPLHVGDRIERKLNNTVYELVSPPAEVRQGNQLEGYRSRAVPYTTLYPVIGVLQDQGGSVVQANVRCAIWGGSEDRQSEGDYFTHNGRTPLDYASLLRPNRLLDVNGKKYRILEAVTHHNVRHVLLSLRSVRD